MQWNEFRSSIRHLSAKDLTKIKEAFELGEKLHRGQMRKSGEPYFNHPIATAHMLSDMGADRDTLVAALMHDTVEDTPVTLEEIDRTFNGDVKMLIDGVTKLSREDIGEKATLDEQLETLRKIITLMEQDVRIMVIKLVDRLHNMQTVGFLTPEKQHALATETLDVYVKIADRLCMQNLRDELEALCLAVLEPSTFTALTVLRIENEQNGQKVVGKIQRALHKAFPSLHTDVLYEEQTWTRLRARMEKSGRAVTGLPTLTCVFLCKDIDGCYRTLGSLHQLWKREVMSFQDFVNAPQINGYRGLHTTIILEDGTRVRCKIRTEEMHEYARKGITTRCFDRKEHGVATSLLWTERISPLAEETKERSTEFWESLQSDILGESIVIHGPADQVTQLPLGATVLDGAFYLFGEETLHLTQIRLNGQDVPLRTPLKHADTLDMEIGKATTVQREWLLWVKTNLAIAKIRSSLTLNQSPKEKLLIGKAMLQKVMEEKKRGFIEEFREETMHTGLASLGYSSLEELYKAIAEGRMEPMEAFRALFEQSRKVTPSDVLTQSVQFSFPLTNFDIVIGLVQVYQRFQKAYQRIRFRYNPLSGMCKVRLVVSLPQLEMQKYLSELRTAGATDLVIDQKNNSPLRFSVGIATLLILWGFDPVMARLLLFHPDITPIDLTIVRFGSLTLMSALVLLLHRLRREYVPEERLPLRNASLWHSVILLFIIALSTYFSLQSTTPSQYTIPMTSAGLLLTSIVNRKRKLVIVTTWALLALGVATLILFTSWDIPGMLLTLIAVTSFSTFSVVSERYKRSEQVGARSAQYFFVLSLLCASFTLILIPFSTITLVSTPILMLMFSFSVIFAGLPYYLYYHLLSHKQIDFILRYSFIIIFTTGLGQYLFPGSGPLDYATLTAALLVTLGAILPLIPVQRLNIVRRIGN